MEMPTSCDESFAKKILRRVVSVVDGSDFRERSVQSLHLTLDKQILKEAIMFLEHA